MKPKKLGEDGLKLNLSEVSILEISGPKWRCLDKGLKGKNTSLEFFRSSVMQSKRIRDEEDSRVWKRTQGW